VSLSVTPQFTLTEEERSLLPSESDVESYAEHGWYLSKKLFTDDEVDELVAASERYYAGERDRSLPVRPPNLAYWDPSKGDGQRHNDYVHYDNSDLERVLAENAACSPDYSDPEFCPVVWRNSASPVSGHHQQEV
jgi:hypothetical protein